MASGMFIFVTGWPRYGSHRGVSMNRQWSLSGLIEYCSINLLGGCEWSLVNIVVLDGRNEF